MPDRVEMKGKRIIMSVGLQQQALDQLHSNHIGKEKTTPVARESIYWININIHIENTVTNCSTCLGYQQMPPKEKVIPHEIPGKPWEVISVDFFFTVNNCSYALCCKVPQVNSP